jgi:hypothetical protein
MKIQNILASKALLVLSALAFGPLAGFCQAQHVPNAQAAKSTAPNAVENGMLTFHAQNQSLRSLLKQISDLSGVNIYLLTDFADRQVSTEFRQYRLDEAFRQMLKDYDVFFLYGPGQGSLDSSALQAVWVYPAGSGHDFRPFSGNTLTTASSIEPAPFDADADFRARVVESVIRRKGPDSAGEVLGALTDRSDQVRARVLLRALIAGVRIPQDKLINLSLTDESTDVRLLALQALTVNADLRWVAERAAGDTNQAVSGAAREILRDLDLATSAKSQAARAQKPPQE